MATGMRPEHSEAQGGMSRAAGHRGVSRPMHEKLLVPVGAVFPPQVNFFYKYKDSYIKITSGYRTISIPTFS